MYIITKVNKYFAKGAKVTKETFAKKTESLEEVLALAAKQGADVDEVAEELDEYGITNFKGYMVDVW